MVRVPDRVSSRTLFWFWLQFATPEQQEFAKISFWRYVLSVELIVQYRQWVSAGLDVDDYALESTRRQLQKYNQTLLTRSQMLRAESRLHLSRGRSLRERSKTLVQKQSKG
ncbi:MAG: hypothetical protein HC840_31295 [Leptolyngbyaceae cyanobacterium RM2_2_4]|nr:hypothetical protein [Leptolyngbyaceae cyanobacterium SM1_4_3]NJN89670.1 hypothetical protein [Leptolyngbyaceae cyanobacterium SL_5_14]NJO53144.1 hypothetical protein [Leptolyngbyaceae cyanobacterium RM2_2_4]NJO67347.1 hypothetical protein [Leptolyngbyaceae cyanobacterium RM1_405_57]